ncbi:hypothetical protein C8R43DRAFT_958756 [Mycena crocata]|nr:hypothetical protein C8R43DRAFT_958756 [Mycena crocata]
MHIGTFILLASLYASTHVAASAVCDCELNGQVSFSLTSFCCDVTAGTNGNGRSKVAASTQAGEMDVPRCAILAGANFWRRRREKGILWNVTEDKWITYIA